MKTASNFTGIARAKNGRKRAKAAFRCTPAASISKAFSKKGLDRRQRGLRASLVEATEPNQRVAPRAVGRRRRQIGAEKRLEFGAVQRNRVSPEMAHFRHFA